MSESWTAVDHLLESFLLPDDEAMSAALAAAEQAGLPPIQVPPVQGRFLHLLARAIGARRVLEFGTLGGYSTIWLARAIPADGRLTTLELNPAYAEVARANLERAGVGDRGRHRRWTGRGVTAVVGRRDVRPDLHRRRQAEHRRLLRLVGYPHQARRGHRRRQRRPPWRH